MVEEEGSKFAWLSAGGSGKNVWWSLILIVLGVVHYVFSWVGGAASYVKILSWLLFFIGGLACAEKTKKDKVAILLPMFFFFLWVFLFNSSISSGIYLLIILAALSVGLGIKTKGEGAPPLIYGLVLVIILFITTGYLEWLITELGVQPTGIVETMLYLIPWWAFVGIVTYPQTDSKFFNALGTFIKVAGIIYLVTFVVSSVIPNFGYESILPNKESQLAAQAAIKEKGIQPWLPIKCAWEKIWMSYQSTASVEDCVKREKQLIILRKTCESKGFQKGTPTFDTCVKEQEELSKKMGGQVAGAVSEIIKQVTTAKFEVADEFVSSQVRDFYPATFILDNPRNQRLTVGFSCQFEKGSEKMTGDIIVSTKHESFFDITTDHKDFPIKCSPVADMNGNYKLEFKAVISGLETPSYLDRAFYTAVDDFKLRKEIEDSIKKDKFPNSKSILSQAPDEFARINFLFGVGDLEKNPVIPNNEMIDFRASIENKGKGKIGSIDGFEFNLAEKGFVVKAGSPDCLRGGWLYVPSEKRFTLRACDLEIPEEYKNTPPVLDYLHPDHLYDTFVGKLYYTYILTQKVDVKVNPPMVQSPSLPVS